MKLSFANVYQVSEGGLDFEDMLTLYIEKKDLYKFMPVNIFSKEEGKDVEVFPEIYKYYNGSMKICPT